MTYDEATFLGWKPSAYVQWNGETGRLEQWWALTSEVEELTAPEFCASGAWIVVPQGTQPPVYHYEAVKPTLAAYPDDIAARAVYDTLYAVACSKRSDEQVREVMRAVQATCGEWLALLAMKG